MVLVAACAQQAHKAAVDAETSSPFRQQDMKLKISGKDAMEALGSGAQIAALLKQVEAGPGNSLRGRINQALNAPPAKLAGLGGIQSRMALRSARPTLGANGNFKKKLTTFTVKGEIQETVDGEDGFYFEPGQPMHMWVEMITTATGDPEGAVETESIAEMFRVEIPANGVVVERKAGTGANVFPGFAGAAFAIDDTMASGFGYKLWAVGTQVKVTHYWIDDDYDPSGDPVYEKYTASTAPPRYQSIFADDPAACIDMMFEKDPTLDVTDGGALNEGKLPAGSEPPYYCLGRCMNPPIVNTR